MPDIDLKEQGEWKEPFYFIQAADPQLGLIKAWAVRDCENGGDEWGQEVTLTQQAVQAVNKLAPRSKFMVLCGDIHAMPGMQWQDEQERDMKGALRGVDPAIPLVFVSGNHNIGNMSTLGTIAQCRCSWGDDYFSFWVGGILFRVLNSQLFFDGSACPDQRDTHEACLTEQLDSAQHRACRHVVVFQHILIILSSTEEDSDYLNLEKTVRLQLLKRFHKAGVKAVFSGHYHRNAGGMHNGPDMVVTSATGCQLGTDPHGLRVVVVTKVIHRYYSLDELSKIGMEKSYWDSCPAPA
ncbi:serine/threonine-protein phosphatase CPPED1-like [Acipenser oxyrinchus oxyrinchus]|uniref:protein-serine/threonine phosphatase n=1 Tax=Acipenser oxyrinchus oxyrinchus TaxID=40147 RepID=A0AAD8G190_ACIOX|nr:serine/threonine-protein phosphatase CPPED1-like [Acipenser oxyrinchus oxyrinchus]